MNFSGQAEWKACPVFLCKRAISKILNEKYVNKSKKSVDRRYKPWYYKWAVNEIQENSKKSLKKVLDREIQMW